MPPACARSVTKGQLRSLMSSVTEYPHVKLPRFRNVIVPDLPSWAFGRIETGVPMADSRSWLAELKRVADGLPLSRFSLVTDDKRAEGADSSAIDSRLRRRETAVTASSPRRAE